MKTAIPFSRRSPRVLRRLVRPLAALSVLLWAFSACDLSESPETLHYIRLRLPDSVHVGDSVQVLLRLPEDSTRLDVLWDQPLLSDTSLSRLPAPHYRGGDADLFVSAWYRGRLFYRTQVELRKGLPKPRVMDVSPADSLAPWMRWQGPDSLDLEKAPAAPSLAALFPEMECVDDRDRDTVLPSAEYLADSARVGLGWIKYLCRDRAGNFAPARYRRLRILSEVDTVPPAIILSEPSDVEVQLGHAAKLGTAYCADAKDPRPRMRDSGSVDESRIGTYPLVYECEDASGNVGRRLRTVYVIREPDTVKPVLTRIGPDTSVFFEGEPYVEGGEVRCTDARDGELEAFTEGLFEGGGIPRGKYRVEYLCSDSAGNKESLYVPVKAIRRPDPVPPRLTLRGQDSLVLFDGETYADAGADCIDAQDGILPVEIHNPVDTRVRMEYRVLYGCADTAGNPAGAERKVRVIRKPDPEKPVIMLRGPDTAVAYLHEGYTDSGAVCLDDRDGRLAAAIEGTIDTEKRGLQTLALTCADTAGNAARVVRAVRVQLRPDTVKPVLTLRGSDSVQVWQGQAYADSGADCADDRDGILPVRIAGILNTGLRGPQSLSLRCADSAGNEAVRIRQVLVIRVPDLVKPVLKLSGPDSIEVWQGTVYYDSGATCADDRDGPLPVQYGGWVNTAVRGPYAMTFRCADSVGNASDLVRKVRVIRVPDPVKPVLTLRGPANIVIQPAPAYSDSGAICEDDRDGILPALPHGSVNSATPGTYKIRYACADSAGNEADSVTRSIQVKGPDVVPPVISLAGTDTLILVSGAAFIDPGGSCRDDEDGPIPLTLLGITKPVTTSSWYQAGYTCKDKAGNVAVKYRTLKIGLFGTYISDTADSQIDTLNSWANVGGSIGSCFVAEPRGNYFGMVRFDLTKVNKAGLKSAKLHFFTTLHGKPNVAGFRKYDFDVYRMTSGWVEGTGDWFYHDGAYRNTGDVWYQNYPLSDSMKAIVTNPSVPSGVTGASVSLVRENALIKIASQSDSLYYGPWCGNPDQWPIPDRLTPVELDITQYIKTADPATDYGFIVKVRGVPSGMLLDYMNREADGGKWAPRLMLEY